ncbi:MAG TPA: AGE family epimerase/isomerase [Pseudomonadales bacterium]
MLIKTRALLDRILTENIVPFWYPQTIDRDAGGYRLNHDIASNWRGAAAKSLVGQARTLWFFARLVNSQYRCAEYEEAATQGFEYLERYFWDARAGGFLWLIDTQGRPLESNKQLYGQAFALYALAEYTVATRDERANERLQSLFELIERHGRDRVHGGYREFLLDDWALPARDAVSYMGTPATAKTLNTNLHLCEAITRAADVRADAAVQDALGGLMSILCGAAVRPEYGVCDDQHADDWSPPPRADRRPITYGLNLESIWLAIEASARLNVPSAQLLDLHETIFFNCWRYGFDHARGGFYYQGPPGRFATERTKLWWVEAEALVCALQLYLVTRRRVYFDAFVRTLDWINRHQVDWERGEWYLRVDDAGVPSGNKAHERSTAWKCPYHNARAMLRCIELIDALLATPEGRVTPALAH